MLVSASGWDARRARITPARPRSNGPAIRTSAIAVNNVGSRIGRDILAHERKKLDAMD
jgi:hypothetical protein